MNGIVGMGLVGCGRISESHLQAITALPDRARLVAVADSDGARARDKAAKYGAARVYDSLAALLADPEVQAVVVCLPNHLHREAIETAAEAGKHVLVEKPMALCAEDAAAIVARERRHDLRIMVGQCRRFFVAAQRSRELARELGGPIAIINILGVGWRSAQTDWWRSAARTGGLVLGLNGPHAIDYLLWVTPAEPVSVYATTYRNSSDWEGEDEATVVVRFEDGAVGTAHLSFNMPSEVNEKHVVCRKGQLRLVNDRELYADGALAVAPGPDELRHYLEGAVEFRRQMAEFCASIREQRSPAVSVRDGEGIAIVLEAAQESARTGRAIPLRK